MSNIKFFKNNLKKLRQKAGLTVQQLADKAGMAQPNVTNIENNKIILTLKNIELFASILGCSPIDIIYDTNEEKKNIIDNNLIQKITNLVKTITFESDFDRNKVIISLYMSLLTIKNDINIDNIKDTDIKEILQK